MREIIFRGKDARTGEWALGFYTPISIGSGNMADAIITGTARKCFIPVLVDPNTVGQYTGLTDANRNKIFEGDIVRITYEDEIGIIAWCKDDGSFAVLWGDERTTFTDDIWGSDVEVLGNVYDNPDMIVPMLDTNKMICSYLDGLSEKKIDNAQNLHLAKWGEIINGYGELEGSICSNCGREVKAKEKYCPNCGKIMEVN